MPRFKRATSPFFTIEEDQLLDISALLSGRYEVSETTRLFVLSPLDSSKHAVELQDLERLLRISADRWSSAAELVGVGADPDWLEAMSRKGLLLSDQDEPSLKELRRRAEVLDSEQWHPYAALYHFMVRGDESRNAKPIDYAAIEEQSEQRARQFVARHGPPPAPFKTYSTAARIELPLIDKQGDLYKTLQKRTTSRAFNKEEKMTSEDVATLLQYVFGCHGYVHLSPEVLMMHRTSPSGGSRHPMEVYPLIMRVDCLDVGLYHYDLQNHALELVQKYDLDEAMELAIAIAGGQQYAGSAHVLFVMSARFYRNHWKYRRRARAYGVVLMDAAHLSQTFYLVAADLNLGTFFSAALDGQKADAILGLDGYEEGAVAVCGCGVKPAKDHSNHSLPFRRFIPRKTKL